MSAPRSSLAVVVALSVACGGDSSPMAPSNNAIVVSMSVDIISAATATPSRLRLGSLSGQNLSPLETLELQITVRRTITAVGGSATVSSGCEGRLGQAPRVPIPELDTPPERVDESQPLVIVVSVRGGSAGALAAIGGSTAELICTLTGTDERGGEISESVQVTVALDDVEMVPVPEGPEPTPPGFSKAFAPSTITMRGISSLTFTIDNAANETAATALTFTDDFPEGIIVATPPNVTTDCAGGTVTAFDGSGTVSYTGGTVEAGKICAVTVDVTSSTMGTYVNTTGDLKSSAAIVARQPTPWTSPRPRRSSSPRSSSTIR